MNKTLEIIGAGDLGQQIAHYAITDHHYDDVVFFDDFTEHSVINGHKIIGKIDEIEAAYTNNAFSELLIGIGYKHLSVRKELYHRFLNKIPFGKIIHSTCWVDVTATVHQGCIVYPNCSVDAHAVIDSNTILNLNCSVSHDSYVGPHSFLSPRVAMAGFVKTEEQVNIGINATIIDNIKIAKNAQIGGGAVVIKDIITGGLYVGNPAKFIR